MKTALIIDDSRLARLTLKRLLNQFNVEVFEAESVADAEYWLGKNPLPSVIFLDVMMPEVDGFEGLYRIRENEATANVPVIMYSGDTSQESRVRAKDGGATGYMPKPADIKRVEHLLGALDKRGTAPTTAKTEPVVAADATPSAAAKPTTTAKKAAPSAVKDADVVAKTMAASTLQPADATMLKRRIDEMEHRLNLQDMNTSSEDLNMTLEQQRRDMVFLQRQLASSERRNLIAISISVLALVASIFAIYWGIK